jgi:hypothetical protein
MRCTDARARAEARWFTHRVVVWWWHDGMMAGRMVEWQKPPLAGRAIAPATSALA